MHFLNVLLNVSNIGLKMTPRESKHVAGQVIYFYKVGVFFTVVNLRLFTNI